MFWAKSCLKADGLGSLMYRRDVHCTCKGGAASTSNQVWLIGERNCCIQDQEDTVLEPKLGLKIETVIVASIASLKFSDGHIRRKRQKMAEAI